MEGLHLLVVRYESDSERKRLEYLLERFSGRMRVLRPGGAVLLVEAPEEALREFLEGSISRIPPKRVSLHSLVEAGVRVGERRAPVEAVSGASVEEAWGPWAS